MAKPRPRQFFDGELIEHEGRTLRVRIQHDGDAGPPWKEYDGHGVVLDWQPRMSEDEEKARGLWLLNSTDHNSARYYDARTSLARAIKDGWGRGQSLSSRRRAVKRDFEFLLGWCSDMWSYVFISVETEDGKESESLGGVKSNAYAHIAEMVQEMAATLCKRLGPVGCEFTLMEHQRTNIIKALRASAVRGLLDLGAQEVEDLCDYLS